MDKSKKSAKLPATASIFNRQSSKMGSKSFSDNPDPGEFAHPNVSSYPEQSVLFYACKGETFTLKSNYKQFHRKLKQVFGFGIIELKEELGEGILQFCKLVIIAGIQKKICNKEKRLLKDFVMKGGSILIMAEGECATEFYNDLLKPFGIALVKDVVINAKRVFPYLPKECVVEKFVTTETLLPVDQDSECPTNFDVVYPHGCTLNLCKSAFPLASTGLLAFPPQRPAAAIYVDPCSKGKLFVFGSGHLFADGYIDKENNSKFLDFVMGWICEPGEVLMQMCGDSSEIEIALESEGPPQATGIKSNCQRGSLIDAKDHLFPKSVNPLGEPEPTRGFVDIKKHKRVKPKVKEYEVRKKVAVTDNGFPLLVKPLLEAPLPPLKLALHPPFFRELPGPPLELFDLDEEFASTEKRLNRLKNKCTDDDLDYYVESMGDILGIAVPDKGPGSVKPKDKNKAILYQILKQMTDIKCGDSDKEKDGSIGSSGSSESS